MFPAYAMSKAALNMLVNLFFYPLVCQPGLKMTGFQTVKQKGARPDLIAITLCPGHVKTGTVAMAFGSRSVTNELAYPDRHGGSKRCA